MAYPTVKVEISLAASDGPYTASPTWTDVTTWVRDISINRGRTSDLEHFNPGTAQITLDNRDNRFTPFNLSGPYVTAGVSALTPRRQIRITATAGGTAIPVFRGYVAGWPVRWTSAGQDSEVVISCFDALGLLGNTDITPDWSYTTITNLSPTHYWRWDDPVGSTFVTDIGSIPRNLAGFLATLQSSSSPKLAAGIPFQALSLLAGNGATNNPYGTGNNGGSANKLSWCSWAALGSSDGVIQIDIQGNGCESYITSRTDGTLYLVSSNGATYTRYKTTEIVGNFVPHHFAVTNDAGTPALYVDGRQLTLTSIATGSRSTVYDDWAYFTFGIFQETAVFDKILTAAQVQSIYNSGLGIITESTGSRAARLLGSTSLPTNRYDTTGSYEGTVSGITGGNSIMPELQKTSDSEGGDLYCDRAGVIQFTGRSYVYSKGSGATAATFKDDGTNLPYGIDLEISYDGDNLINDVTVTTASGGSVRVTNSATTNGTASTTIDTYLSTNADAQSLASLKASSGSTVLPTVSPFDVSNAGTLANWSTILGLELLDKISLTRTPTSGTTFTQTMLVNNITHQITPARWQTTLTGSAKYIGYFVLDVSKLDGTDVLA